MTEKMQPLLSSLCGICNTNTPQYRCPRCSARTCSLPCYKRHQKWAQCSGKRDPAAFVKKSKLATPAGIDHDYNFLVGIERELDRSERDVRDRQEEGNVSNRAATRHEKRRRLPVEGTALHRQLQETGVVVKRAPPGMLRAKENETRVTLKARQLVWTVEWVLEDGMRHLALVRDTTTIAEAYDELQTQLRSKRKRNPKEAPRKRHRSRRPGMTQTATEGASPTNDRDRPTGSLPQKSSITASEGEPTAAQHLPEDMITMADDDSIGGTTKSQSPIANPEDNTAAQTPDPAPPKQPYFYLHRPLTPASTLVLIPLSPRTTLQESLRSRVVLEFPTVHVRTEAPDGLPPRVLTEDEYWGVEALELEQLKRDADELDEVTGKAARSMAPGQPAGRDGVDADEVLKVLRRDLGR